MKFLLLACLAFTLSAQDPKEIVAKALERDENNTELLNRYSYQKHTVIRFLEKDGTTKKTQQRLEEVFFIDGTEIERTVEKDGKPLTEKEAEAERKRVDKEIEKIKNESPAQRAKRRREREKDKQEEAEARREILDAYNFELQGREVQNGLSCWVIAGKVKPGWKGKGRRANQIKALSGRLWVDQATNEWVRMQLESSETLAFGWFIFRLQKGAQVEVSQAHVNNEVWLPRNVKIRADARVLGKMMRIDLQQEYRNFKKFSTDSQLLPGEVEETKN
jgi:hypothetical protein